MHASNIYIDVLVTMAMGGVDIDVRLLVYLRRFVKEDCIVGLCLVERGSALTQKHIQMVVRGGFYSLLVLNKTNKVCLGWDVSLSNGSCCLMQEI